MNFSPVVFARIGAVVVGAGLIALVVLLSRTEYAIKGTIQVDTGAYVNPARQCDVRLMQQLVEQEMNMLAAGYDTFRAQQFGPAVAKLRDAFHTATNGHAAGAAAKTALSLEDIVRKSISTVTPEDLATKSAGELADKAAEGLPPLTDDEREQVTSRVKQYLEHAVYCRDITQLAPIGAQFYEGAAQYWEDRVSRLKDSGRLITDDAQGVYKTEWLDTGGLGDEPVQRVSMTGKTNVPVIARKKTDGTAARAARKKVKEGGVIAGCPLTSNDFTTAAAGIHRALQQQYQQMLARADNLMLEQTLDKMTTDDEGHFVFKGDAVQPGNFILSARYDSLSAEGERIEYTWFEPVSIPLRRFAFDKATTVRLDELNQKKPPHLALRAPAQEDIVDELIESVKTLAPPAAPAEKAPAKSPDLPPAAATAAPPAGLTPELLPDTSSHTNN